MTLFERVAFLAMSLLAPRPPKPPLPGRGNQPYRPLHNPPINKSFDERQADLAHDAEYARVEQSGVYSNPNNKGRA